MWHVLPCAYLCPCAYTYTTHVITAKTGGVSNKLSKFRIAFSKKMVPYDFSSYITVTFSFLFHGQVIIFSTSPTQKQQNSVYPFLPFCCAKMTQLKWLQFFELLGETNKMGKKECSYFIEG
ncbi:hypothetical protein POVWA1_076500 [Plasmodium ovale wallikeri]|uniref:Uncharacterized protein n=1 Tax=Plasmodium ovale wallikeri TaxID=864142 RepID=A0A1A9AIQ8_PLAOA|nr:hypothetical protein POVWA1_076500 [Plasmodium ovale wallikeri]